MMAALHRVRDEVVERARELFALRLHRKPRGGLGANNVL
jgi:hypothetical protein